MLFKFTVYTEHTDEPGRFIGADEYEAKGVKDAAVERIKRLSTNARIYDRGRVLVVYAGEARIFEWRREPVVTVHLSDPS